MAGLSFKALNNYYFNHLYHPTKIVEVVVTPSKCHKFDTAMISGENKSTPKSDILPVLINVYLNTQLK